MFTYILIVLGIVLLAAGYFMEKSNAPASNASEITEQVLSSHEGGAAEGEHGDLVTKRLWANLLLGAYFTFLLGSGGLFFVAVKNVANAGWHVGFKRIPEAMATYLPLGGLFVVLIGGVWGVLGSHYYHWSTPGIMDTDKILNGK